MNPPQAPHPAEQTRQAPPASTRGRLVIRRHEPEPKALTLLWSLYLLVAAGMTIFAVDHLWIYDANDFRLSSKVMIGMVGLGIGALWPMVRLSQTAPRNTAESVFADAVALCVPAQAVLWPLTLLGGWTWGVSAAIALTMIAWTALIGGFIALGVRTSKGAGRSFWMLLTLACITAAPIWAISTGWTEQSAAHTGAQPDWRLCSPLSMGWGLTNSLNGAAARMTPEKWNGLLYPGAAAAILWSCFAILQGLRRAPDHARSP